MNPLLLAGGAAGILALLLFGGKAKASGGGAPSQRPPYTTPVEPVEQQAMRVAICERGGNGSTTILTEPLAAQVWKSLYPSAPWPTRPDDHPTVLEAEQALRAEIAAYILDPQAYCAETADQTIDMSEVERLDNPQPGYLYQVKSGEYVNGAGSTRLVYRALLEGGKRAALDAGADMDAAIAFGKSLAENPQARARYRNLLYCDIYNDLYLNTYGFDAEFGAGGPNGRRFRNLPQHEDDRARIAMGISPLRRMPIMTKADEGKGTAKAKYGKLPYLHFPLLDYERLMNTNLPIDARLVYGKYGDGSSGALPPPPVQRIMSTIGLPDIQYGCSGAGFETYMIGGA